MLGAVEVCLNKQISLRSGRFELMILYAYEISQSKHAQLWETS